jgi:hypothetical protein
MNLNAKYKSTWVDVEIYFIFFLELKLI